MSFRDDLFSHPSERTIEAVETPAGTTYVRTLMVGEKDRFDVSSAKDGQFRARLVMACCCDEQGRPVFQDGDVHRLNDMPVHLLEPIVDAAIRLNKIGPQDAEAIRGN